MGVSACACPCECMSARECESSTSREDLAIFCLHFYSAQRAKIRSDLNPITSDFSQNANSVECRRLIVEQKCEKENECYLTIIEMLGGGRQTETKPLRRPFYLSQVTGGLTVLTVSSK